MIGPVDVVCAVIGTPDDSIAVLFESTQLRRGQLLRGLSICPGKQHVLLQRISTSTFWCKVAQFRTSGSLAVVSPVAGKAVPEAMASATSLQANSDPFDLGVHTPHDLARLARAAQLRDSSPIVNQPIGAWPAFRGQAQTPSSPLTRLSNTAAVEGAQAEPALNGPGTAEPITLQPVSIVEGANRIAHEQTDAYHAKLAVFEAFCVSFELASKRFTTDIEHKFSGTWGGAEGSFWIRICARNLESWRLRDMK